MSVIYILTNPAMPDFIKIGRTENSVTSRMLQLDTTGVPLPFQCYYAAEVENYQKVEKAIHVAFDDFRSRKNREFFQNLDPHKVRAVLELMATRDVTPREETFNEADDEEALVRASNRGKKFSFQSVEVPIGSVLHFVQDESITCLVKDDNHVEYNGELTTLSRAALNATHSLGYKTSAAAGPLYWLYQGESLNSIKNRLELETVAE
jgi:hypothetical protein